MAETCEGFNPVRSELVEHFMWRKGEEGDGLSHIFIAEGCAREAEGEVRDFSPSLLSFPCLAKDVS